MRIGECTIHYFIVRLNPFFSKEKICLMVGYIVDLTLILCSVFSLLVMCHLVLHADYM